MPSFISEAAVDATGPCRWAMRLEAVPRLINVGEPLPLDRAEVTAAAERGHRVEPAFEPDHARADVAALVGEHGHADAPTAVQRTEQVLGRAARRR